MSVEVRLQAAGRMVDPSAFEELSGELAGQIADTHRRGVLGSRRRRLLALGAAGALLVPAGAAAAVVQFRAETGHYGEAGMTENDTSQYINMCATDFRSYVASLAPTTRPLPAGTTWAQLINQVATPPAASCPPVGPGATEQVTGIKSQLLLATECPWEGAFLRAHAAGDDAEQDRAGAAVASAEDAVAALGAMGDDGWKVLRNAAARGDVGVVQQGYHAYCAVPAATSK